MSAYGCGLNRSTQHSDGDIEERVCGGNHAYHQAIQGTGGVELLEASGIAEVG